MKLVTFEHNGTVRIGAVKGNGIVDLTAVSPDHALPHRHGHNRA